MAAGTTTAMQIELPISSVVKLDCAALGQDAAREQLRVGVRHAGPGQAARRRRRSALTRQLPQITSRARNGTACSSHSAGGSATDQRAAARGAPSPRVIGHGRLTDRRAVWLHVPSAHQLEDVGDDLLEPGVRGHALPGPLTGRMGHRHDLEHPPGPRGHRHHVVAEEHRLVDAVGDEDDGAIASSSRA